MENAKCRVLLPTDVVHYYIGCYVLDQLESKLDRRMEIGEPKDCSERAEFLVQLMRTCEKGDDTWAFDWDNFNG